MPVEYFFPKAFYYKDELISEDENGRLLQAAYALRQEIPESSRTNLYTTYGSVANILERSEFAVLRDALIPQIVEYLAILETREGNRCVVTDSWVSISAPGNYERMHTHDGSYVSGVYYIKTAPGCGELYFEELLDNLWASRRMKAEHFNTVSYTPVERRVILFSSRVAHHVGQNMSSEDRIALSFNVSLL
jgi:uncharacterized protein (TIGR02466 family)